MHRTSAYNHLLESLQSPFSINSHAAIRTSPTQPRQPFCERGISLTAPHFTDTIWPSPIPCGILTHPGPPCRRTRTTSYSLGLSSFQQWRTLPPARRNKLPSFLFQTVTWLLTLTDQDLCLRRQSFHPCQK